MARGGAIGRIGPAGTPEWEIGAGAGRAVAAAAATGAAGGGNGAGGAAGAADFMEPARPGGFSAGGTATGGVTAGLTAAGFTGTLGLATGFGVLAASAVLACGFTTGLAAGSAAGLAAGLAAGAAGLAVVFGAALAAGLDGALAATDFPETAGLGLVIDLGGAFAWDLAAGRAGAFVPDFGFAEGVFGFAFAEAALVVLINPPDSVDQTSS